MTIIGTSHYRSLQAAISYYLNYGYTRDDVADKVVSGEITIGEPKLKPGQRLVLLDNRARYGIEEVVQ